MQTQASAFAPYNSEITLRASDIRQYMYCARQIYYLYCLPLKKVSSYKMEVGKEEHTRVFELEKRRSLKPYGLSEGDRFFHITLESDRLALNGVLDMAILSKGKYYPVEFKFSERSDALGHKYQLTAYSMLLEDKFSTVVRIAFINLIPVKRVIRIPITESMRAFTICLLGAIRKMISSQYFPKRPSSLNKCIDCEYKRFCADF